jgi:hypothetical protein
MHLKGVHHTRRGKFFATLSSGRSSHDGLEREYALRTKGQKQALYEMPSFRERNESEDGT